MDLEEEIHWKYNVTIYCVVPAILRSNDLYITIYVNWMYFFVYYAFPFVALVVFNVAIYRRVSFIKFSINNSHIFVDLLTI